MKIVMLIFTLLFSGFYSSAQKIKYKDLYVLLRAKNYNDGAGFLKSYITTNPEHPNANYQMGLMLEYKLSEFDLLKESEEILTRADSAILYFDRAYGYITPKEVKKHDDDYYELFKRRNLRTGKFEVILSDVQLDIEDRKNSLQKKKNDVALINTRFNSSVKFYEQANGNYQNLRALYKDELTLSLGAVDSTVTIINNMIVQSDSAYANIKEYKKLKKEFQPSSIEVIITNTTYSDFSSEALRKPDYYGKKIDFYNFSLWGAERLSAIEEWKVFMDNLIEFDNSLQRISERIATDSVDLSSDIFKKITSPTLKEIKSIDPESLLVNVFQYKISQLNYASLWMNWHNQIADTVDVGLQMDFVNKLKSQLEGVARLEAALHSTDESIFMLRYHKLVEARYSTKEKLFNYINNQAALVKKQEEHVATLLMDIEERDKWGYWKEDTISLSLQHDTDIKFSTFYADSLENRAVRLVGLTKVKNKSSLFFITVPSSRVIDSLFLIETEIESIDLSSAEFIIQNQNTIAESTIYLIGIPKKNKFIVQLVSFNTQTGIVWNTTLRLNSTTPPQLNYADNQIEISQGDIIKKYYEDTGLPVEE
jgi:hypothetical protein